MKAENSTRIQFDSLSSNEPTPAALRRPFWHGTIPPCRSWPT